MVTDGETTVARREDGEVVGDDSEESREIARR
jgi:hypothetical protein